MIKAHKISFKQQLETTRRIWVSQNIHQPANICNSFPLLLRTFVDETVWHRYTCPRHRNCRSNFLKSTWDQLDVGSAWTKEQMVTAAPPIPPRKNANKSLQGWFYDDFHAFDGFAYGWQSRLPWWISITCFQTPVFPSVSLIFLLGQYSSSLNIFNHF